MKSDPNSRYWRKNKFLILCLLLVWALVSLGLGIVFVEPVNQISLGKLKLGFWFAQQGSIYVFVILIFIYARRMDKIDREHEEDLRNEKAREDRST